MSFIPEDAAKRILSFDNDGVKRYKEFRKERYIKKNMHSKGYYQESQYTSFKSRHHQNR